MNARTLDCIYICPNWNNDQAGHQFLNLQTNKIINQRVGTICPITPTIVRCVEALARKDNIREFKFQSKYERHHGYLHPHPAEVDDNNDKEWSDSDSSSDSSSNSDESDSNSDTESDDRGKDYYHPVPIRPAHGMNRSAHHAIAEVPRDNKDRTNNTEVPETNTIGAEDTEEETLAPEQDPTVRESCIWPRVGPTRQRRDLI